MPVCVLAGVAVVVTAVRWLPSVFAGSAGRPAAAGRAGHRQAAAPAVRAGGRVVFVTPSGELALANPDGSHLARASSFGAVGNSVGASPDNHYLSLLNGQVISVRPGPELASYPAKVQLSSQTTVALPDPFADHERAVVMLSDFGDPTQSASNPISVISIATGRSVSLGTGDQVDGDPAADGVFATVTAPSRASAAVLTATLTPGWCCGTPGARRPCWPRPAPSATPWAWPAASRCRSPCTPLPAGPRSRSPSGPRRAARTAAWSS